MQEEKHPPSLSVFFPAYNDSGTIASLVIRALQAAGRLTPDHEVLIINDGSRDATPEIAEELARLYPQVRVIHHEANRGYGGALRSGFAQATKDFIFYTDGDAQYDPREMTDLWERLGEGVDMVNGYKISRSDPLHRIIIGRLYHHTVKLLFGLKVRDVDCDFRLMRRAIFERVRLEKSSGVICLEMMKKIQDAGFRHRRGACPPLPPRVRASRSSSTSGESDARAIDVLKLWWALVVRRRHMREAAASAGLDRSST